MRTLRVAPKSVFAGSSGGLSTWSLSGRLEETVREPGPCWGWSSAQGGGDPLPAQQGHPSGHPLGRVWTGASPPTHPAASAAILQSLWVLQSKRGFAPSHSAQAGCGAGKQCASLGLSLDLNTMG